MSEILEIHWNPDTEMALARWLMERGQLRQVTSADMATPEMVDLSLARRRNEAVQAVRELRTVLNARAIPVLDIDILNMRRIEGRRA